MEYICETTNYNVAEFHDRFQEKLPLLVKVVQGYCGEIASDVFDRDQVIRIQTVARQKRVISKFKEATYQHRLFSIPSSYFDKVCIVNKYGKARDEKFMFEVLRGFSLPQTVRFPKNRTITLGNSSVSTNNIPDIELVQIFEEVSLLGNFINDGKMCTDLTHVPLYLSHLRLAVITGIKGYSPSQWKQFNEELDVESLCVEYDMMFGNPEIAEYDPHAIHSDDTYTYVEPRIYSNIVKMMQPQVVHSLPADEAKQTAHGGQEQNVNHGDVYEEIQSYTNVTKQNKAAPIVPPKPAQSSTPMKHEAPAHDGQEQNVSHGDVYEEIQSYTNVTKQNKAAPIVPPKPAQSSTPMKHEAPTLPKRKTILQAHKPQENVAHNYTNDVPRTQVKPTMHDKRTSMQSQHLPTEKSEHNITQAVKSTKVPNVSNSDDVSKLTIDEVIVYLQKLGLGQYEQTFREQMIDGVLLLELDRDLLKDDFGMKGIEAVRLTRFAKTGHIPM